MTDTTHKTQRETLSSVQGRRIVVELLPTWVELRLKGKRYRYQVPYSAIFELAAKISAREARKQKEARRK